MIIANYLPRHGPELVAMWRESFELAVGVIDCHPLDEQLRYLEEKVVPENEVLVVLDEGTGAVIGFMASTHETISQLYVHVNYQRRGIGSLLVNIAKEHSGGLLRLFVFQANQHAQQFYEQHGFKVKSKGFVEEWQLADIGYEWSAGES